MGVDSDKPPPLPAPTETDSTTPTELATDVSRPNDETSHYSLPEDGTPVTIKTRGHRPNRSQTSLLIEYFEGGKPGDSSSVSRKPSVRVRLTPSKKHRHDHIQITETKSSSSNTRKTSLARRVPLASTLGTSTVASSHHLDVEALEGEDGDSMRSYASATEESNVSKNPIDIEIDRSGGRRRRPASPLIPDADAAHESTYLPPNMSEISAIPNDSFLDGYDGSGSTVLTKSSDVKRGKSSSRGGELAAGAAGAMAGAAAADQVRSKKRHSGERKVSNERSKEKERKHRPSKSRTSSISEKQSETGTRSPRRRSSRSHVDSVVSGVDSSILTSSISPSHRSYDQSSVRSGASKSSINNPKLLETVEDAIRRLILPELSALKREQSKRESRRSSITSTGTGTSLSREDLGVDRRRSSTKGNDSARDSRHRERRDREARHDFVDSPRSIAGESVEGESVLSVDDTPRRSNGALKAAAGGAAAAGLAAAALSAASPAADDRRQRRRRRADGSARSRSLGREKFDEEYEEEEVPAPPMPLMSEINPSEMTRTSILSADTDRPHSAMEERLPTVQEVAKGNVTSINATSANSTPTPTQTPASNLQQTLGTKHANISHGDLRELSRTRTGELTEQIDNYNSPVQPLRDEYDDYDDRSGLTEGDDYDDSHEYDYYNTQDVPPPLKYVPYQPERRGLSPIYSVSGYTEGGSEAAQRDSRLSHGTASPTKSHPSQADMRALSPSSSIPSNVMGRGFDEQSLDERSVRSAQDFRNSQMTENSEAGFPASQITESQITGMTGNSEAGYRNSQMTENSDAGYRNSQYTENSDVGVPGQAVRGIVANPNIVHVPNGVESNVASLIDGSMLDQSIMTTGSGYDYGRDSQISYGDSNVSYVRDSQISYDAPTKSQAQSRDVSPEKRSVASQREFFEQRERESSRTPTSSRQSRSREFNGEYEIDEHGRKIPTARYRNSPSTSTRHSPTASEKAIAAGAVGAAAAALRAAKDKKQPTVEEVDEEDNEDWVGDGVSRNKSFKQRTMEGREPNHTPAHSIDRLDLDDQPKMGASAMPTMNDPMPEVGYMDDDALTNPSLVQEPLGGSDHGNRGHWPGDITPRQSDVGLHEQYDSHKQGHDFGMAAAGAAAGAAAAMALHRQPSRDPATDENEWRRTSAERKRDTVITNPYDGASPIENPELLGARGFDDYAAQFHGSPGHKNFDEGYISQGPMQSPIGQPNGKAMMPFNGPNSDDPFYAPQHTRHLSGMSQGMASPLYDASTGNGIDNIESKDIIALMQHLMVRDAQRSARDTEILVTLVRSAAEMRNSFEDLKKLLANTEDVIIKEVQENTEETVKNVIGGPRPYPGSLPPRSIKASGASQNSTLDETTKKSNFFKKALKGLSTKGTNDLSRIEDMLNQLLSEVDTLKAQTVRPGMPSDRQSFENLDPEAQYDQDRGYEPEGQAGTSSTSHGSGMSSFGQSRGPSKMGYEPNRISTVHEDNEEDYHQDNYRNSQGLMTPTREFQRGGSVPLGTPPQPVHTQNASLSNENTPKTDKGKKHKSRGSSSWFPKISRWSESTATSVSKAFRVSGSSKKDQDEEFLQHPPSRSGSDLRFDDRYQDDYQSDQLHTGYSQQDLAAPPRLETIPPAPNTYMTPEDPKYKAHRNSVNLQHPQPRQGQTERFKAALESQAYEYDTPMSPNTADWAGSATSLHRLPANANRYSGGSGAANGEYWNSSPAGPPRPPKEPIEDRATTPSKPRISKLGSKNSPLPYNSVESGYGTGAGTQPSNYTGSPKPENRNLNAALGMPARRPSGPRAMTPKSAEEEAAREERRRKRDTFGTVASNETDTF
ncbi:hypothetical protein CkaCkLH20_00189 [Colletotrichum karsti]|uniref:Uncharacterized protein n=1 Tax=Colletotrichum karsti TaxID=1095194 RepID=A0A9P6IG28_9PEZI|nr:uncharacterized protein CkaCkLH20_00189 [Colletotrichum karsti]KAF9882153.1 hypothetical protein CkaCkLH20_00189 [Colletotrichum karsti]